MNEGAEPEVILRDSSQFHKTFRMLCSHVTKNPPNKALDKWLEDVFEAEIALEIEEWKQRVVERGAWLLTFEELSERL